MKTLATFFILSILAILFSPLYITVDGMPLAQWEARQVPTIQETGGARLLAWNIEGTQEFSVFVPFDSRMYSDVKRAFKAYEVARALGITDATFDIKAPVVIEFGGPNAGQYTVGVLHINAHGDDVPRAWFEFMNPTLCFSDSLSYAQIFPEVKR